MNGMFGWVLHSLWYERGPVIASALGIALAMLLGLYLDAVFRGEADQIVQFIERAPGGVWVLQNGVHNLHMNRSTISEQQIADVRSVDGVSEVQPVLYRDVLVGSGATQRIAYVVGISSDSAGLGPWSLAAGRGTVQRGEVIVPEPLARAEHLELGDQIRVEGRILKISGLSRETFSMANPFLFVAVDEARDLLHRGDGANLILVTPAADIDSQALARRIREELDNVQVLLREELSASDRDLAMQMGGALIGLMALIGLVVNLLIVSFAAYVFLSNRQRELAVSRAIGARPQALVGAAILFCVALAAFGCVIAGAVIPVSAYALGRWVPEVAVHFSLDSYLYLSAGTLLMAVVAALPPALRVLRLDPALVFNE